MSEHHHHHNHGHNGHKHTTDANKDFFDKKAHEFKDIPGAQKLSEDVVSTFLKLYSFSKSTTTLLDFACGPGTISCLLAPHTKSILGVDISQGMINEFHRSAAAVQGTEMKGIVKDLLGETYDDLGGQKFDVVICCHAYHHFADRAHATKVLSSYLNKGGVLLVADFTKFPHPELTPEQHKELEGAVPHLHEGGANIDEFKKMFEEDGGLVDFGTSERIETSLYHTDAEVIVFKGTKS